jgi:hypothetical protein
MGKLLTLLGLGVGGYYLLKPRPGFCIETIGRDNGRRCVEACYPNKMQAKREVATVWGKLPNLKTRIFESKNVASERLCH